MKIVLVTTMLFIASFALAQNEQADAAFCKYTMEQGMATRDQLRSPSAVIGPIQPSTGTPPQLVIGVTTSLTDTKKASLTMDVARRACDLYTATTEAQMHLMYALPQIEKDVLKNRLRLIDDATAKLDSLAQSNMAMVDSKNLTMPAVYPLISAKIRLDESRTTALTGIASPYVPTLRDVPIRQLVADKLAEEDTAAKAAVKLQKQNSWDFSVSAGTHRRLPSSQISSDSQSTWGAYGAFNFTYNLGRKSIKDHLDKSVDSYNEWKRTQFDDVTSQAKLLKKQIEDTLTIQQSQLKAMENHDLEIGVELTKLEGVETANAIAFRNDLYADQVMLRVNIEDAKYRCARLRQYLTENF